MRNTTMVKSWMTRKVVTIDPTTKLPEAHRLMDEHRVRRLPVVQDGQLLGIVTSGDIREAEPSHAAALTGLEVADAVEGMAVAEIMTQNPITIAPHATIDEAAWLMLEYKASGLPVIDKSGAVVGIITESDIFRMIVQQWREMSAA